MIKDKIENSHKYDNINKHFYAVFKFLMETDFDEEIENKYILIENELFCNLNTYVTKELSELKWEAHKKYIDIQYIISGTEKIGYTPLENINIIEEYDSSKDILFGNGNGDLLTVKTGEFVVLFPGEAHMPGISTKNKDTVKKIVVKINTEIK